MIVQFNNREVEVTDYELEVGEGIYVIEAVYTDTGAHLSDSELQEVEEIHQSDLYIDAYSGMVSDAHDRYAD